MFCTENKQTRGGTRTPGSSMIELFVTVEVISYWQSSTKLDDGGIVELPLYAIIFSFHDEAGIMGESWMGARAKGVQAFHILVPSMDYGVSETNCGFLVEWRTTGKI